jgi:hypothetical protein
MPSPGAQPSCLGAYRATSWGGTVTWCTVRLSPSSTMTRNVEFPATLTEILLRDMTPGCSSGLVGPCGHCVAVRAGHLSVGWVPIV